MSNLTNILLKQCTATCNAKTTLSNDTLWKFAEDVPTLAYITLLGIRPEAFLDATVLSMRADDRHRCFLFTNSRPLKTDVTSEIAFIPAVTNIIKFYRDVVRPRIMGMDPDYVKTF